MISTKSLGIGDFNELHLHEYKIIFWSHSEYSKVELSFCFKMHNWIKRPWACGKLWNVWLYGFLIWTIIVVHDLLMQAMSVLSEFTAGNLNSCTLRAPYWPFCEDIWCFSAKQTRFVLFYLTFYLHKCVFGSCSKFCGILKWLKSLKSYWKRKVPWHVHCFISYVLQLYTFTLDSYSFFYFVFPKLHLGLSFEDRWVIKKRTSFVVALCTVKEEEKRIWR